MVLFQLLCFTLLYSNTQAQLTKNVDCYPYEKIIDVSNSSSPYFVKVHRCQGGDMRPRRMCKSTKETKENVTIYNGKSEFQVTVTNHTECTFQCAYDLSACNVNEVWFNDTCECNCTLHKSSCRENEYFDNDACSCNCQDCGAGKVIIPETCECMTQFKNNIECHPFEKVVNVINDRNPYFIILRQCQGGDTNRKHICRPTNEEKWNVTIFNEQKTNLLAITVSNHTECASRCELNNHACKNNQVWNSDTCECSCHANKSDRACGSREYFDNHACSCRCIKDVSDCRQDEEFDSKTCQCIERKICKCTNQDSGTSIMSSGSGLAVEYVVITMLVEFFLVVAVCVFVFRKFFRKPQQVPEKIPMTNGEA